MYDFFNDPIEQEQVGPYTVKVLPDSDGEYANPLDGEDLFNITYRADSRYILGNEPVRDVDEWIMDLVRAADPDWEEYECNQEERIYADPDRAGKIEAAMEKRKAKVIESSYHMVDVYTYIHSGVAMKAGGGFSCPWDSGRSGVIYAKKSDLREAFQVKRLTKAKIKEIEAQMRVIVQTYGEWLNGEVYGFVVEDEDGEVMESCWGFVGIYSGGVAEALKEGKDMARFLIEQDEARAAANAQRLQDFSAAAAASMGA